MSPADRAVLEVLRSTMTVCQIFRSAINYQGRFTTEGLPIELNHGLRNRLLIVKPHALVVKGPFDVILVDVDYGTRIVVWSRYWSFNSRAHSISTRQRWRHIDKMYNRLNEKNLIVWNDELSEIESC